MFSIVIPTFNVENEIERSLKSIVNQTFKNFEIIVADDGSTDNTVELCKKYSESDSRIKVIESKHVGKAGAMRNLGLKAARFEYILFADSDDELVADALSIVARAIEDFGNPDILGLPFIHTYKSPEGQLIKKNTVYNFTRADGVMNGTQALEKLVEKKRQLSCYSFGNAYRREFLLSENLFQPEDVKLHEDSQWLPRVVYAAKRIAAIDTPYYHYIRRLGSITSSLSQSSLEDISAELKSIAAFFDANITDMSIGVRRFFAAHAINSFFWYFFNPLYENKLSWKIKMEILDKLYADKDAIRNISILLKYASLPKRIAFPLISLAQKGFLYPAKAYFKYIYFKE